MLQIDKFELVGSIPSVFGEFTALSHFDLDSNSLIGIVVNHLGSVNYYFLCKGFIPTEIGLLTSLGFCSLSGNSLAGWLNRFEVQY